MYLIHFTRSSFIDFTIKIHSSGILIHIWAVKKEVSAELLIASKIKSIIYQHELNFDP